MQKKTYKVVSTGYVPRTWQANSHRQLKRHNILVFHRRGGKTVLAVNEIIDRALRFNKVDSTTGKPFLNPQFAFVATTIGQVEKIAWPYFKYYLKNIPGVKFNESKLRVTFPHPAGICTIFCFGAENFDTMRGIYLDGYVLDEYADMHPDVRDKVLLPTLSDRIGWEIIIGTPKGDNSFKELYDRAVNDPDRWYHCLYRASETGIIPAEELKMLKETMSDEAYRQEYECDFNAAPSDKYLQKYMDDAVRQGRITDVPHNPSCLTNVYWDMGRDGTALWFIQEVGREVHVIRYHELIGRGLEYAVDYLKECEDEFGYRYNEQIVPHDADHHEQQVETTRVEFLENQGLKNVRCLTKTLSVAEDIHAIRVVLRHCWFDRTNCNPYIEGRHRGIASLREYSRKYDSKLKVYSDRPVHNWASHGCFVGDTKIKMEGYSKRIDQIKVGERVSLGNYTGRVTEVYDNGIQEVIKLFFTDGTSIECTKNHKIFTSLGLTYADALGYGDMVLTEKEIPCQLLQGVRTTLSTNVRPSMEEIITRNKITSITTANTPTMLTSIEKFGNTLMEKFLKVTISTIKTVISPIIESKISNVSVLRSILNCMVKQISGLDRKLIRINLLKLANSQKYGIVLMREGNGIVTMERKYGELERLTPKSAYFAVKNIKRTTKIDQNIATKTVKQIISVERSGKRCTTYDLTIKGHHAYIANGILVSNCDALRNFAVDYQPGFGKSLNERWDNLPSVAEHDYDILG